MRAYPYYLSQSQWYMAKCNVEAAIGVSIDVVVHRLGGVNVCEHTLKRMSSVSLALCSNPLSFFDADHKAANLLQVKTSYRRVVRAVKQQQRTQPSRKPYIVNLPCNPADLEKEHPEAGFNIEGCWTDPPVKMQDVYVLDTSYSCRMGKVPSQLKMCGSDSFMKTMLAFKDMMCSGQRRDESELDIRYLGAHAPSSNKRSLRDLMEGMNAKKPRRSFSDCFELQDEDAPQSNSVSQASEAAAAAQAVSYTHLRAHETPEHLV